MSQEAKGNLLGEPTMHSFSSIASLKELHSDHIVDHNEYMVVAVYKPNESKYESKLETPSRGIDSNSQNLSRTDYLKNQS